MSASDPAARAASPGGWLANQPYALLCITALCWAGNAIVGRLAAGHIPPVTLSFMRWALAFLIILPFAWKHLKRDWGTIRARLGTMIVISVVGISIFNTLQKNLAATDFSTLLLDVMTIADEVDSQLKQTMIGYTQGVEAQSATISV